MAYEYVDVLSRKIMPSRWERLQPVVGSLLSQAHFVVIYYSWRPSSPDPADEHVVDCALNSGAAVVTWNLRDFHSAQQDLGLQVQKALAERTEIESEVGLTQDVVLQLREHIAKYGSES